MDVPYKINIPTVLDVGKIDFNALCAGAPSLSSDSTLGVIPVLDNSGRNSSQTSEQSLKEPDAVDLECYCLNRLAEIRKINDYSHTAPAFSCVMAFIGFLSELAYGRENETRRYVDFCHKFIGRIAQGFCL